VIEFVEAMMKIATNFKKIPANFEFVLGIVL
jgi:hypothetical protein